MTTIWSEGHGIFGALGDKTRRDIVCRAIEGEERGAAELAEHYSMSFAALQKHIAILERAGLVSKHRIGRRKLVSTNLEALRVAGAAWRCTRRAASNGDFGDANTVTHHTQVQPMNYEMVGQSLLGQGLQVRR